MTTIIHGGIIVNEGMRRQADIIVEDDRIKEIIPEGISACSTDSFDVVLDASGCYVLPGVIDSHVHFRDPGLTHKGDMHTESLAALAGGVTTVFDMPNTKPQTTTVEALHEKQTIAEQKMHVNYAFFPGVTNDNLEELQRIDTTTIPGFKLFMGSSTGNMLVDREQALEAIFRFAGEKGITLMAHCEDTETINRHMAYYKQLTGSDDPDVRLHPLIRNEEACMKSSELGVRLAQKYDTHFHIAHVSTACELEMIKGLGDAHRHITCEATVAHLLFSTVDYDTLGTRIKCNPAVKGFLDREALRCALTDGTVSTIGTDHAPHTLEEKSGGSAKAMSGMPMIQFSLISMLSLVDEGVLSMERLVQLMAHNPAKLFGVSQRGFLRQGYKADMAIVKQCDEPWTLTKDCILSRCGWSPLEGRQMQWRVKSTILNGRIAFADGKVNENTHGEPVRFEK
ncbi:MAG: dihydroorotase [Prevotella sp.]|nr:dihydroorotase [Prevotella sp.]